MTTSEKAVSQKEGTMGLGNVGAIYRHDKVTITTRAGYGMVNYNVDIMKGRYNFRRGLVQERDRFKSVIFIF
jgi:hypothetical protein